MFPFRRILVAVAGAETDRALLCYAARLVSAGSGVEVRCVHISERGEPPEKAIEVERATLARAGEFGANEFSVHLIAGDCLDRLLEFAGAHEIDLILLGHRIGRGARRSLARRLAMKAPCSVWMAPEGSPAGVRRILVPVDFSTRAADALGVATSIAESAGLDECHALHVHFNDAAAGYDEYEEVISDQEDRAFLLFLAPIDMHGVYVKPLWVEGASVARTIARVAGELGADLIVMGTRGRSRSAAVLLGSETEQTLLETHVPVLAVKHFGARRRLLQVLLDKRVRDRGGERFT